MIYKYICIIKAIIKNIEHTKYKIEDHTDVKGATIETIAPEKKHNNPIPIQLNSKIFIKLINKNLKIY